MRGQRWLVLLGAGVIGVGASLAANGCGDDERGSVTVEGGSTSTTATSTTTTDATTPTQTTP